jgi:hypothetical protein
MCGNNKIMKFSKGDRVRIKGALKNKILLWWETGWWCPKYARIHAYREDMVAWELVYPSNNPYYLLDTMYAVEEILEKV